MSISRKSRGDDQRPVCSQRDEVPAHFLAKLDGAFGTERRIAAFGSAAARLLKAYAMQVEVLRRLRNGGQQFVRVEHVHIHDGGRPSSAI
jgi:hypothetical protein